MIVLEKKNSFWQLQNGNDGPESLKNNVFSSFNFAVLPKEMLYLFIQY